MIDTNTTIVRNLDGSIKLAFVTRSGITQEGREYDLGQVKINDLAAEQAFEKSIIELGELTKKLTEQLASSQVDLATRTTERDTLQTQVDTLTTEKAALTTDKESLTASLAEASSTITGLQSRVTELEALVVELTPPPAPLSITRYQCTTWLRSAKILQPEQSVSDLVKQIVADPDAQMRALDRWELGTSVLRSDPMIETLGELLGMTTEQLDEAFLVASRIQ